MSHFTVLVKVNKETFEKYGNDALEQMLLPYKEEGAPKQYLEFFDQTNEVEKSLKEKDALIDVDSYLGERNPEFIGKPTISFYDNDEERYLTEHHGYRFNDEANKWGYWRNPNATWDWYEIGGRWPGMLPVKPGAECGFGKRSWASKEEVVPPNRADIVKVKDLDVDAITGYANAEIEVFWKRYSRLQEIKGIPHDQLDGDDRWLEYDLHSSLLSMGIRKCVKQRVPMVDEAGNPVLEPDPFDKSDTPKMVQRWSDALFEETPFTKEDLYTKYRWNFEWMTYAVVDDNGWHSKGEMGWFAMSSDSLEDRERWNKEYFERFLANEDGETILVLVDAHI